VPPLLLLQNGDFGGAIFHDLVRLVSLRF